MRLAKLFTAWLLLATLTPVTVHAQPVIVRFKHPVELDSRAGKAAEYLKRLVEQRSNDRINIEFMADPEQESAQSLLESLRNNSIQMAVPDFTTLADSNPHLQLFDLPFLFDDLAHLHRFMDGEAGRKLLHLTERNGLIGLSFWDDGFRQLTANRALADPQDVAGLKLQLYGSRAQHAAFKSLGVSSQALAPQRIYQGLKDKQLDGQENTLAAINEQKLYRVQSHLTISNHGYQGYIVLANNRFWSELPDELKVIVLGALQDAAEYTREMADQAATESLHQIQQSGALSIHVLSPAERDKWRKSLNGTVKELYREIDEDLVRQAQETQIRYN